MEVCESVMFNWKVYVICGLLLKEGRNFVKVYELNC